MSTAVARAGRGVRFGMELESGWATWRRLDHCHSATIMPQGESCRSRSGFTFTYDEARLACLDRLSY